MALNERLQILGPCPWWGEAARLGRLEVDGASLPVAIVLGPELGDPAAVARARERAAPWLGRRDPGVLPLVAVEVSGSRVAWVYEDCEGMSAAALLAALSDGLPLRAGPEVVAACAAILEPLVAEGLLHPGPGTDDVLILPDGSVRIAGFVGPFAPVPARRDPRSSEAPEVAVWRLGVLLAELLTGSLPSPVGDRLAHELMLRRLLVRIMSRPGPMFPERCRDWLGAMLSWELDQRPILPRIAPGLRELADAIAPPGLRELATRIPEYRAEAIEADRPELRTTWLEPGPGRTAETPPPVERTEEAVPPNPFESDDITAVSYDNDPPLWVPPPPEHGAIPVVVGPPPEAVPRRFWLPAELFAPIAARAARAEIRDDITWRRWRRASGAASVLVALAMALLWYLWS